MGARRDQLQCCNRRLCDIWAVAVGSGAAQREVEFGGGAQRNQLQRWDRRLREFWAMAVQGGQWQHGP
eukprot:7866744-Pyramimonas_sp.AAC.1